MFLKNTQILMKICSVGAELFHVDGRTDTQEDRHDEANNLFMWLWEHT